MLKFKLKKFYDYIRKPHDASIRFFSGELKYIKISYICEGTVSNIRLYIDDGRTYELMGSISEEKLLQFIDGDISYFYQPDNSHKFILNSSKIQKDIFIFNKQQTAYSILLYNIMLYRGSTLVNHFKANSQIYSANLILIIDVIIKREYNKWKSNARVDYYKISDVVYVDIETYSIENIYVDNDNGEILSSFKHTVDDDCHNKIIKRSFKIYQ